jgi:2-keto-4-pentenoate hydratase
MSDELIEAIADAFVAAHRDPTRRVAAANLTPLSAEAAMAVQGAVVRKLGETVPLAKVAVAPDGRGLAAPIISELVIDDGGTLVLAGKDFLGLEIEIAVCLGQDLTPEIAARGEGAVLAAIDHFIVGIELIGTRIDDRSKAGTFGPMADNMITAGYVRGAQKITSLLHVDGLSITATINGVETALGLAKHPFGSVLNPVMTYAAAPFDQFGGLRAGMVVTTGSLCPLITVPKAGDVSIRLGDFDPVSLTLS